MAGIVFEVRYNKVGSLPAKARDAMGSGNLRAAQRIVAAAKQRARVRTGYMRGQTTARRDGLLGATATAGAYYSGYLNFGTRHISPDYWFSGAVEQERANAANDIRSMLVLAVGR